MSTYKSGNNRKLMLVSRVFFMYLSLTFTAHAAVPISSAEIPPISSAWTSSLLPNLRALTADAACIAAFQQQAVLYGWIARYGSAHGSGWDFTKYLGNKNGGACRVTYWYPQSGPPTPGDTIAPFNVQRTSVCPPGSKDRVGNCFSPNQTSSPANKGAPSQCIALGNPINTGTGNKFQHEEDYASWPFGGVVRYYNSQNPSNALNAFGFGWSVFPSIQIYGSNAMEVYHKDQRVIYYSLDAGGLWVSDPNETDSLVNLTDVTGLITGYRYTQAATGNIEEYDANGHLVLMTSPNGIKQTLTYSYRRITVTDNFGRQLLFYLDQKGNIIKMIDPAGGIYTYVYDASYNLSSVTYPDGKVKTYLYGEAANVSATPVASVNYSHALTGIVDENGSRFASWSYDAQGRAISSTHANGVEKVTLTFNADGSTSNTDALGITRTQTYQIAQGVVKNGGMNQPGGSGCAAAASSFSYDANGNMVSRIDFNGNQTTFVHDLVRNLGTSRTEGLTAAGAKTPATRTILTTWHPSYRLPASITEQDSSGATPITLRSTAYTYDVQGNLLTRTVTDGPTSASRSWTYRYNTTGQVLTVDGPRTDVTDISQYTYDALGNLLTVSNALNQSTSLGAYDANGRPATLTDPNGLVTGLSYDARGRLTSRNTGGELTRYTYDGVGSLTHVTLPTGAAYTYTYDAAHRLTQITDAQNNKILYTLDAADNRTKEQLYDAAGTLIQTHSRVFDALNRLQQDIGAVNQTTRYTYDANGNLTSVTDPLTRLSTHSYDALNRLIGSTDPAGGQTRYGYDALNQLASVSDPRNLVTQYTRDGLGNLKQLSSPDSGTTGNTYDAAGNLLSRTDAKGQVASYSYDALNRLAAIRYSGGTRPAQSVGYQYDQGVNSIGHLSAITDATGMINYSYDPHGRLTQEVQQAYGATYTTAYRYDPQGRLSGIVYPSGRTVGYSFDPQGRIAQITTRFNGSTNVLVSSVVYRPFGGVQSYVHGDGLTALVQKYTRQYDQDGRIASYTLGGKALSLGYDAASQISFVADALNPANAASYSYDPLSRLTGYSQGTNSQNFGYDADGNRISQTVGATAISYAYPASSNRLASIATGVGAPQAVSHDANGATTADGSRQYAYDQRGRLVQATTAQGIINYEVNALGLRVRKQVPYAGSDTLYHYDSGGHLIGESANGTTRYTREYIYLGDLPVAVLQ